jgi:hypothetical protein
MTVIQKVILAILIVVVLVWLYANYKKTKQEQQEFSETGNYKDVITQSGTIINNARLTGFGVIYDEQKVNQFDSGQRSAKFSQIVFTNSNLEQDIKSSLINGLLPTSIGGGVLMDTRLFQVKATENIINKVAIKSILYY